MKLTENDKKVLQEDFNLSDVGISQIQDALDVTTFKVSEMQQREITADEARSILGDDTFLDGLVRSAFHCDCSRDNEDGSKTVYFDSSKYTWD